MNCDICDIGQSHDFQEDLIPAFFVDLSIKMSASKARASGQWQQALPPVAASPMWRTAAGRARHESRFATELCASAASAPPSSHRRHKGLRPCNLFSTPKNFENSSCKAWNQKIWVISDKRYEVFIILWCVIILWWYDIRLSFVSLLSTFSTFLAFRARPYEAACRSTPTWQISQASQRFSFMWRFSIMAKVGCCWTSIYELPENLQRFSRQTKKNSNTLTGNTAQHQPQICGIICIPYRQHTREDNDSSLPHLFSNLFSDVNDMLGIIWHWKSKHPKISVKNYFYKRNKNIELQKP